MQPVGNKFFLTEHFLRGASIEISQELFEDYLVAQNVLNSLHSIEHLFSICAMSYVELEKLLATTAIEYMLTEYPAGDLSQQFDILGMQLNLKISSLLTAFRAYTEQCQKRLVNVEAFSEGAAPDMKVEFSKAFDGSIEYRIMDALRNYAQHADMPLHGTVISHQNQWESGRASSKSPARSRITIDPYFSADELAKSQKIKSKTRKEITALKVDKLDSKILIRKYVSEFAKCHLTLRDRTDWIVDHAGAIVEDAYRTVSGETSGTARFVDLQKLDADGNTDTRINLLPEKSDQVKKLRTKWTHLTSTIHQFASSEVTFSKDTFLGSDPLLWIPK